MKPSQGSWGSNWDAGVGYKRPPKHSQFQPGKSGNPKGRPRKQKGPRQLLEEALSEVVTITENGVAKAMSKQKFIFKLLVTTAAKGNGKAMSALFKLMADYGIDTNVGPAMNEMIIKLVGTDGKKKT
jgi:Family of unknown function (DUF5681)